MGESANKVEKARRYNKNHQLVKTLPLGQSFFFLELALIMQLIARKLDNDHQYF